MSNLKELKAMIKNMTEKWEGLFLNPVPGENPYAIIAMDLYTVLDELSPLKSNPEVQQIISDGENLRHILHNKAMIHTAYTAEKLKKAFIKANQELETSIQEIKENVSSVKNVATVLSYLDQLIKIAAAVAAP
jgi:6-pyruvoyl-tetrahydropterin synthase